MSSGTPSSNQLIRYHLRRDDLSPFDVLASRNTTRIFWSEPDSRQAWAGTGCEARLSAAGPGRFDAIREQASELLRNVSELNAPPAAGYLPRLFGGFAFSDDPSAEIWAGFPPAEFFLPQIQAVQMDNSTWVTVSHLLQPGERLETVRADMEARARALRPQRISKRAALLETRDKITFFEWQTMVDQAIHLIKSGKMEKVVLSRARAAHFASPIDPLPVLQSLGRDYPQTFRFLFSPKPGQAFFGATPELLVRVARRQVYSLALAGSTAHGGSLPDQQRLADDLLHNAKDRHEHAVVVEAIRNALRPLTTGLQASEEPHVRRLANIQHLETRIQATLSDPYDIYDVTRALHPTAAVGGAPRQAALDFVTRAERDARGWYAAPVGWLDAAGDGVFAVAIRSALCDGNEALLYAGAGIVAGSDPAQEWQETELKFRPLMEALAG